MLLIRDPAEVVASYVALAGERASPTTSGCVQQAELYDQLGAEVPVIDSADFLRDPEGYLRWLCDYVGVAFTDAMLHWPAGPRESDGVWAPYWYDAVLASTGFAPYRPARGRRSPAPRSPRPSESRPYYERLHAVRVTL